MYFSFCYFSHDEFGLINNVLKEYNEMNKSNQKFKDLMILRTQLHVSLSKSLVYLYDKVITLLFEVQKKKMHIQCLQTIYKKTKKKYKKLKKQENELDKACFQHDMVYRDFKDLTTETTYDKILRDKAFNIPKNPK